MAIKPNDLIPPDRYALSVAWNRVTTSGRFILGTEVRAFEEEWGDYCDGHCVAVGSGFDALQLSLRALGIGRGDKVLVPSNTCMPTWLAVMAVMAQPVPIEPEPQTRNIDPRRIEAAIDADVKAIVPVHLYGMPANMLAIEDIAQRHGLVVIEDACQAHGAMPVGFSPFTCYSFYPTKNLGALGDGGAIIVHNAETANELRKLRNYGMAGAVNSRMDELQAAILRERLPMLDTWNEQRNEFASLYLEGLANVPDITLPTVPAWAMPCWHQFVIQHKQRDKLRAFLASRSIDTLIHYPTPPHQALNLSYQLPYADMMAATVLSLPIAPHLTTRDIKRVIVNVREFCECE